MKYFKNVEVAQLYGVSEKSVRNWIAQSHTSKVLDLYEVKAGKLYIADTTKNSLALRELAQKGRKYHNTRTHKIVSPNKAFYLSYNDSQIADIAGSLERFNELPFHYCHIGPGLNTSIAYYERLESESGQVRNSQSYAKEFLTNYGEGFLRNLTDVERINIVELGGRTGRTIDTFIKLLDDRGLLGKYVDVDISQRLLEVAGSYMKSLLGDGERKVLLFEKDILRDRIDDVTMMASQSVDGRASNIVCLIGGILNAFNDMSIPLKNVRNSMGSDDFLLITTKLDTEVSRRYFDFSPQFESSPLPKNKRVMIDILGFEENMYDTEQFYDKEEQSRKIQVRLKFDVTLKVKVYGSERALHFKKGETILLWRSWHQTLDAMMQELRDNGFKIVQAATSPDEQYGIVISRIQTDKINHR